MSTSMQFDPVLIRKILLEKLESSNSKSNDLVRQVVKDIPIKYSSRTKREIASVRVFKPKIKTDPINFDCLMIGRVWECLDYDNQMNTLNHELAHIIAMHYGDYGHGLMWSIIHRSMGGRGGAKLVLRDVEHAKIMQMLALKKSKKSKSGLSPIINEKLIHHNNSFLDGVDRDLEKNFTNELTRI